MLNEKQDQIIKNLSTSQRDYDDNVKCFMTFGHLFNYNPHACVSQTYCIQGKPALNADAMCGIVRNWIDPATQKKVCAFMKADVLTPEYDDQGNVNPHSIGVRYTAMRSDELQTAKEYGLDAPIHTWTFTMFDAQLRGTANKRTWVQMPVVMCGKRAATALCRLVFPDVVGTACSPDELAEMMLKDDDEISRIAYASNGEQIPNDLKKKSSLSRPPAPQPAPQPSFELRDFTNIHTVLKELTDEGIDIDDAIMALENYMPDVLPNDMTEYHFKQVFYPMMFSPFRLILRDQTVTSFDKEGLEDVDVDTLAAMFDAFYGTYFEPSRDGDVAGYCANVIKWSYSPWFSELTYYMNQLLSKDLIKESEQERIIHTITQPQNLYSEALFKQFMKDLPSLH